jgi:hypothetical protein
MKEVTEKGKRSGRKVVAGGSRKRRPYAAPAVDDRVTFQTVALGCATATTQDPVCEGGPLQT